MANQDDPRSNEDERRPAERIIDVSNREPVLVEDDERPPFYASGVERGRIFVAGGGTRACAIPAVLILLLTCCACVGLWVLVDNFF